MWKYLKLFNEKILLPQDKIDILKEKYPYINNDILENFPFEQPRPGHLKLLKI